MNLELRNILNSKNLFFPNEYGVEAWVLIGVLGVVANGSCSCCCHLLSIVVDFMLLFSIYCFLFWVCRWYLLSTCSLYWPLLVFFSLSFVECNNRTINFNSSATLASLQYIRFQGELLFLARTGFSPTRIDVLKLGHGPSLLLFSFLNILRFSTLRIDVLVVMTSRFWGMISFEF